MLRNNNARERHSGTYFPKSSDPNFLSIFYSHSRLHHLTTWKAKHKAFVKKLQESGDKRFPGLRELKRTIAIKRDREGGLENIRELWEGGRKKGPEKQTGNMVMHIDMDCFFAAVSLINYPELRGKPVAVAHYAWKMDDPSKGKMKSERDRQEEEIWAEEKISIQQPSEESPNWDKDQPAKKWPQPILPLPTARSVQSSGRDNFMSLAEIASCSYEARQVGVKNGMIMKKAKELCPELQTIPYDFDGYYKVSKVLYETVARYTHDIEACSCDELLVDITKVLQETGATPLEFAHVLREEIYAKTQCTASAGLAPSAVLARLCTRVAKPNGSYQLTPGKANELLSSVPVRELPGVGGSISKKLQSLGVTTCADLQQLTLDALQKQFGGKTGHILYQHCRGEDDRPIRMERERKYVSVEVNYGIRFKVEADVIEFMFRLSAELHKRLRDLEMAGRTLTVKLKVRRAGTPREDTKFMGYGVFDNKIRSATLPQETDDLGTIRRECRNILLQMKVAPEDIRGVGVQISRLRKAACTSRLSKSLEDMLVRTDSTQQSPSKRSRGLITPERSPKKVKANSLLNYVFQKRHVSTDSELTCSTSDSNVPKKYPSYQMCNEKQVNKLDVGSKATRDVKDNGKTSDEQCGEVAPLSDSPGMRGRGDADISEGNPTPASVQEEHNLEGLPQSVVCDPGENVGSKRSTPASDREMRDHAMTSSEQCKKVVFLSDLPGKQGRGDADVNEMNSTPASVQEKHSPEDTLTEMPRRDVRDKRSTPASDREVRDHANTNTTSEQCEKVVSLSDLPRTRDSSQADVNKVISTPAFVQKKHDPEDTHTEMPRRDVIDKRSTPASDREVRDHAKTSGEQCQRVASMSDSSGEQGRGDAGINKMTSSPASVQENHNPEDTLTEMPQRDVSDERSTPASDREVRDHAKTSSEQCQMVAPLRDFPGMQDSGQADVNKVTSSPASVQEKHNPEDSLTGMPQTDVGDERSTPASDKEVRDHAKTSGEQCQRAASLRDFPGTQDRGQADVNKVTLTPSSVQEKHNPEDSLTEMPPKKFCDAGEDVDDRRSVAATVDDKYYLEGGSSVFPDTQVNAGGSVSQPQMHLGDDSMPGRCTSQTSDPNNQDIAKASTNIRSTNHKQGDWFQEINCSLGEVQAQANSWEDSSQKIDISSLEATSTTKEELDSPIGEVVSPVTMRDNLEDVTKERARQMNSGREGELATGSSLHFEDSGYNTTLSEETLCGGEVLNDISDEFVAGQHVPSQHTDQKIVSSTSDSEWGISSEVDLPKVVAQMSPNCGEEYVAEIIQSCSKGKVPKRQDDDFGGDVCQGNVDDSPMVAITPLQQSLAAKIATKASQWRDIHQQNPTPKKGRISRKKHPCQRKTPKQKPPKQKHARATGTKEVCSVYFKREQAESDPLRGIAKKLHRSLANGTILSKLLHRIPDQSTSQEKLSSEGGVRTQGFIRPQNKVALRKKKALPKPKVYSKYFPRANNTRGRNTPDGMKRNTRFWEGDSPCLKEGLSKELRDARTDGSSIGMKVLEEPDKFHMTNRVTALADSDSAEEMDVDVIWNDRQQERSSAVDLFPLEKKTQNEMRCTESVHHSMNPPCATTTPVIMAATQGGNESKEVIVTDVNDRNYGEQRHCGTKIGSPNQHLPSEKYEHQSAFVQHSNDDGILRTSNKAHGLFATENESRHGREASGRKSQKIDISSDESSDEEESFSQKPGNVSNGVSSPPDTEPKRKLLYAELEELLNSLSDGELSSPEDPDVCEDPIGEEELLDDAARHFRAVTAPYDSVNTIEDTSSQQSLDKEGNYSSDGELSSAKDPNSCRDLHGEEQFRAAVSAPCNSADRIEDTSSKNDDSESPQPGNEFEQSLDKEENNSAKGITRSISISENYVGGKFQKVSSENSTTSEKSSKSPLMKSRDPRTAFCINPGKNVQTSEKDDNNSRTFDSGFISSSCSIVCEDSSVGMRGSGTNSAEFPQSSLKQRDPRTVSRLPPESIRVASDKVDNNDPEKSDSGFISTSCSTVGDDFSRGRSSSGTKSEKHSKPHWRPRDPRTVSCSHPKTTEETPPKNGSITSMKSDGEFIRTLCESVEDDSSGSMEGSDTKLENYPEPHVRPRDPRTVAYSHPKTPEETPPKDGSITSTKSDSEFIRTSCESVEDDSSGSMEGSNTKSENYPKPHVRPRDPRTVAYSHPKTIEETPDKNGSITSTKSDSESIRTLCESVEDDSSGSMEGSDTKSENYPKPHVRPGDPRTVAYSHPKTIEETPDRNGSITSTKSDSEFIRTLCESLEDDSSELMGGRDTKSDNYPKPHVRPRDPRTVAYSHPKTIEETPDKNGSITSTESDSEFIRTSCETVEDDSSELMEGSDTKPEKYRKPHVRPRDPRTVAYTDLKTTDEISDKDDSDNSAQHDSGLGNTTESTIGDHSPWVTCDDSQKFEKSRQAVLKSTRDPRTISPCCPDKFGDRPDSCDTNTSEKICGPSSTYGNSSENDAFGLTSSGIPIGHSDPRIKANYRPVRMGIRSFKDGNKSREMLDSGFINKHTVDNNSRVKLRVSSQSVRSRPRDPRTVLHRDILRIIPPEENVGENDLDDASNESGESDVSIDNVDGIKASEVDPRELITEPGRSRPASIVKEIANSMGTKSGRFAESEVVQLFTGESVRGVEDASNYISRSQEMSPSESPDMNKKEATKSKVCTFYRRLDIGHPISKSSKDFVGYDKEESLDSQASGSGRKEVTFDDGQEKDIINNKETSVTATNEAKEAVESSPKGVHSVMSSTKDLPNAGTDVSSVLEEEFPDFQASGSCQKQVTIDDQDDYVDKLSANDDLMAGFPSGKELDEGIFQEVEQDPARDRSSSHEDERPASKNVFAGVLSPLDDVPSLMLKQEGCLAADETLSVDFAHDLSQISKRNGQNLVLEDVQRIGEAEDGTTTKRTDMEPECSIYSQETDMSSDSEEEAVQDEKDNSALDQKTSRQSEVLNHVLGDDVMARLKTVDSLSCTKKTLSCNSQRCTGDIEDLKGIRPKFECTVKCPDDVTSEIDGRGETRKITNSNNTRREIGQANQKQMENDQPIVESSIHERIKEFNHGPSDAEFSQDTHRRERSYSVETAEAVNVILADLNSSSSDHEQPHLVNLADITEPGDQLKKSELSNDREEDGSGDMLHNCQELCELPSQLDPHLVQATSEFDDCERLDGIHSREESASSNEDSGKVGSFETEEFNDKLDFTRDDLGEKGIFGANSTTARVSSITEEMDYSTDIESQETDEQSSGCHPGSTMESLQSGTATPGVSSSQDTVSWESQNSLVSQKGGSVGHWNYHAVSGLIESGQCRGKAYVSNSSSQETVPCESQNSLVSQGDVSASRQNTNDNDHFVYGQNQGKTYVSSSQETTMSQDSVGHSNKPSHCQPPTERSHALEGFTTVPSTEKWKPFLQTQDPEFLTAFYKHSRYHHMSTWREEHKFFVNELQMSDQRKLAGREKARVLMKADEKEEWPENETSTKPSMCASKRGRDLKYKTGIGEKSVIMHIDMDCFFVAVSLLNIPELIGKPLAVTHSYVKKSPKEDTWLEDFERSYLEKKMWTCPAVKTVREISEAMEKSREGKNSCGGSEKDEAMSLKEESRDDLGMADDDRCGKLDREQRQLEQERRANEKLTCGNRIQSSGSERERLGMSMGCNETSVDSSADSQITTECSVIKAGISGSMHEANSVKQSGSLVAAVGSFRNMKLTGNQMIDPTQCVGKELKAKQSQFTKNGGNGKDNSDDKHSRSSSKLMKNKKLRQSVKADAKSSDEPNSFDMVVTVGSCYNPAAEIASCSYEARDFGVEKGMLLAKAKQLCPRLQTLPYDFENYHRVSRILYETVASFTNEIEAVSCDEMFVDVTQTLQDTGATPLEFAKLVLDEIFSKTQCTASAGIASNPLLARLSTKRAKPNGIYQLTDDMVDGFMKNIPVRELPKVGEATGEKLKALSIRTCGELQELSLAALQAQFGQRHGHNLYHHCRGKNDQPIRIERQQKLVSSTVNYGIRFSGNEQALTFVSELAEVVHRKLKKCGMAGRTISLKLKIRKRHTPEDVKFLGHGSCDNRTKTTTFVDPTDDLATVQRECRNLLLQMKARPRDIRGVGIHITRLKKARRLSNQGVTLKDMLVRNSDKLKLSMKSPENVGRRPVDVCSPSDQSERGRRPVQSEGGVTGNASPRQYRNLRAMFRAMSDASESASRCDPVEMGTPQMEETASQESFNDIDKRETVISKLSPEFAPQDSNDLERASPSQESDDVGSPSDYSESWRPQKVQSDTDVTSEVSPRQYRNLRAMFRAMSDASESASRRDLVEATSRLVSAAYDSDDPEWEVSPFQESASDTYRSETVFSKQSSRVVGEATPTQVPVDDMDKSQTTVSEPPHVASSSEGAETQSSQTIDDMDKRQTITSELPHNSSRAEGEQSGSGKFTDFENKTETVGSCSQVDAGVRSPKAVNDAEKIEVVEETVASKPQRDSSCENDGSVETEEDSQSHSPGSVDDNDSSDVEDEVFTSPTDGVQEVSEDVDVSLPRTTYQERTNPIFRPVTMFGPNSIFSQNRYTSASGVQPDATSDISFDPADLEMLPSGMCREATEQERSKFIEQGILVDQLGHVEDLPSFSDIDPTCMDALPAEIHCELMSAYRRTSAQQRSVQTPQKRKPPESSSAPVKRKKKQLKSERKSCDLKSSNQKPSVQRSLFDMISIQSSPQ